MLILETALKIFGPLHDVHVRSIDACIYFTRSYVIDYRNCGKYFNCIISFFLCRAENDLSSNIVIEFTSFTEYLVHNPILDYEIPHEGIAWGRTLSGYTVLRVLGG